MECILEVCARPVNPGGAWAHFLGYVTLVPPALYILGGVWFVIGLDWPSVLYNLGLYWNLGISMIIKVIVRAPRPNPACMSDSPYGFPSTHSQTIAHTTGTFAIITFFLLVHQKHKKHPIYESFVFRKRPRLFLQLQFGFLTLVLLTATVFEGIARVQLQYHTVGQVLGGSAIGFVTGLIWVYFSLWFHNGFVLRKWWWRQRHSSSSAKQ